MTLVGQGWNSRLRGKFAGASSGRGEMLNEIVEQRVEAVRVVDKQGVAGILEQFDACGRNGRNNWIGGHALQLRLAHHEHGPVDPGKGGPPVGAADGADAGSDGAVRWHLEGSCDDALDVLLGLRLLVHAAHEFLGEFPAVGLNLFAHPDHRYDELWVLFVQRKAVHEYISTDVAAPKLFGIGQQLRNAERPADKNNVVQLEMFDEFFDILRAAFA